MDVVRLHQAGVTDAVATLGTATTPEHLRRAFRLVSEVVFCFDGDRAGRAAAWRALQQALPEAREGRELRFLFLPEGEDPDSLVGREGGEQFAARLDTALPLSEYLVAQLGEQADVSHADGKAHFVALAGRCWKRSRPVSIASCCSIASPRRSDCRPSACSSGSRRRRPRAGAPRVADTAAARSARAALRPVGRGSLVTQAITLLLHFPAAATAVSEQQRVELTRMNQPGVAVLMALLEQLEASPAGTMALTLERWRDRPEYRRLCELAASEPLVPDQDAAGQELRQAVARLLDTELRRRLEVLIEKARAQTLDEAEKAGTSGPHGCPNQSWRPLTMPHHPGAGCGRRRQRIGALASAARDARPFKALGNYVQVLAFAAVTTVMGLNTGTGVSILVIIFNFSMNDSTTTALRCPATDRAVLSETRVLEAPQEPLKPRNPSPTPPPPNPNPLGTSPPRTPATPKPQKRPRPAPRAPRETKAPHPNKKSKQGAPAGKPTEKPPKKKQTQNHPNAPPAGTRAGGRGLPEDRQSQLKLLIARGKEQGYLTYAQVNDHLPAEIVDPEQIEDIVNTINDMGIPVYEKAPDTESLLATEPGIAGRRRSHRRGRRRAGRARCRTWPHHRPGAHVHARDGHGRAADARRRDPHRQAHRGRPGRGAHRARQVSGHARTPGEDLRAGQGRPGAPGRPGGRLHRSECAGRHRPAAESDQDRTRDRRRGEGRRGRGWRRQRRGSDRYRSGSAGSRAPHGLDPEAAPAGAGLDRQARRRRSQDAEAAQEAGRRVHGAQALAAHVRRADRPAAHAHQRDPPDREGDHDHRGARRRHAAQGLHRHLPEERDQRALARRSTSRPARNIPRRWRA